LLFRFAWALNICLKNSGRRWIEEVDMKNKIKKHVDPFTVVMFVFLVLFSISLLYLLFWSLITAFKMQEEFRLNKLGMPENWTMFNFKLVYDNLFVSITVDGYPMKVYVPQLTINTIMYVVGCAFMQTLTPCIVAYAVTKFAFKFNVFINTLVFVVMSLPIIGSTVSELKLLQDLGLYDTMVGMWIQKTNFAGLYFLVFCAAFRGVSKSFYEAAYIDGASELKVMLVIGLPMVVYTFFTVFLIQFIAYWNDYQTILLFLPSWPTLSLALYELSISTTQELNNVPARMAGSMAVMIPTLILFILFSNRLMGNVSLGGVKE
jgi:ABC-type glycerol-3-phosphate transport system permease component